MATFDTKTKPQNWRTKATHDKYMADVEAGGLDGACPLCERGSLQEFEYWKVITNDYPYDRVAELHEMIAPKRHTDGTDLSDEEWQELETLKKTVLNERYRFIIEGLPNAKSIPGHFHLHLIVPNQP